MLCEWLVTLCVLFCIWTASLYVEALHQAIQINFAELNSHFQTSPSIVAIRTFLRSRSISQSTLSWARSLYHVNHLSHFLGMECLLPSWPGMSSFVSPTDDTHLHPNCGHCGKFSLTADHCNNLPAAVWVCLHPRWMAQWGWCPPPVWTLTQEGPSGAGDTSHNHGVPLWNNSESLLVKVLMVPWLN